MNPDPKTETELDETIAVQGTPEGDELTIPDDAEGTEPEDADAMEEAQEDAAEERKEGGYQ